MGFFVCKTVTIYIFWDFFKDPDRQHWPVAIGQHSLSYAHTVYVMYTIFFIRCLERAGFTNLPLFARVIAKNLSPRKMFRFFGTIFV
jgi:hypothetical protein